MSTTRRGCALTKKSWALLRSHPGLIRFPLYGAVATVPLAIVTIGPGLYLFEEDVLAGALPLLVIGIYALSVVGFYFSVGLAAAADMVFRGQANVTVGDGLAISRERFSQICGWAAISTAISVVMGVLENQGGIGGQIAARLVGMAWALVTFLAVPVIALEGTGPFETLKRSASIFREGWGQQITGNLAIGGAVGLLGILPAVLLIVAGVMVWSSAPLTLPGRRAWDRRCDRGRRPPPHLQGPERDIRRRALPLRDRRPGARRLHQRGGRVRGQGQEGRAQQSTDGGARAAP